MIEQPRYATPVDAIPDFTAFAGRARTVLHARPAWGEWLADPAIADPAGFRGAGKWRQDWTELAGGDPADPSVSAETALSALRRLRQREYLRLGLLDFAGFAPLEQTVEALSALADFCLGAVLDIAQRDMVRRFGEPGTGFLVLAMGKLGGQELNYSSDVDVVFVYGEEGSAGRISRQEYFIRLAQRLTQEFSRQTPDGNLFRIDLRLRPEGDSGPLARSLEACEYYYAAHGETWERLALLKARRAAGDAGLGYEFEQLRASFCFPRSFSPGLFAEIGRIKTRIEREVVGEANLDLHVKLGRGGIREVEFIVQAFQVLEGARLPYLQQRSTLKALEALATVDILPEDTALQLHQAYRFWRMVEHRLQMRDELQTHSLPREPAARALIAHSLGLEPEDFEARAAAHREVVNTIFQEVFAHQQEEEPYEPDLSFCEDAQAARRHLGALLPEAGRGSHASRRTRQAFDALLRELEPALRRTVVPETCLVLFVRFVEAYGARGLLFESLARNPRALELMLKVFDRSQFYADVMIAHPEMFEDVVRAGTLDAPKSVEDYRAELDALEGDLRLVSRTWRRGELLRIFLRDVLELAPLEELSAEYSALAEACLRFAMAQAAPGANLLVLAMGKFGGHEIFYGSDLDCLMAGGEADATAGREVNRYMGQILPTGILFPMDFRLRPNGEGPICQSAETYLKYYREKAQAWEIQALTRARFAAGDSAAGAAFIAGLDAIWHERIGQWDMPREIARMRRRIETERVDPKYPEGEFKTGPGGLIDVEFGVQAHLIANGRREPSTLRGLDFLAETHPELAAAWREGYHFLRRVEAVVRANQNDSASRIQPGKGKRDRLARHLGFPDRDSFLAAYNAVRRKVREGYAGFMPQV